MPSGVSFCTALAVNFAFEVNLAFANFLALNFFTSTAFKNLIALSIACRYETNETNDYFTKEIRKDYFKGLSDFGDQVILLDPDIGFESEKSCIEKHIKYSEISIVLDQISADSIVSIFQQKTQTIITIWTVGWIVYNLYIPT